MILKSIDGAHYTNGVDSDEMPASLRKIDNEVRDAFNSAEKLVVKKEEALDIANSNEKSLLLERENMKDEYEKLKRLHSVNMAFHKDHIKQLVDSMQSMTIDCDDLQQQLRVVHLHKNLQKEEYEKLQQKADQCTVVLIPMRK